LPFITSFRLNYAFDFVKELLTNRIFPLKNPPLAGPFFLTEISEQKQCLFTLAII
jgi:hypothetical protein